jgi:hypothetical protein
LLVDVLTTTAYVGSVSAFCRYGDVWPDGYSFAKRLRFVNRFDCTLRCLKDVATTPSFRGLLSDVSVIRFVLFVSRLWAWLLFRRFQAWFNTALCQPQRRFFLPIQFLYSPRSRRPISDTPTLSLNPLSFTGLLLPTPDGVV